MGNASRPIPSTNYLGNYELFEEIGRGGMGVVYRGLDLSLDREVAIKVLRDDLRSQEMIVSRFAREARAVASLDHPNIVQIYSVGESEGTPYIAMEFVRSEALSALMIREKKLPWQRALSIGAQIAAALAAAHDAQIVHRDVKPPNILLTPDDKAYVTDFGIAKILSIHDQLTVDGTRLGTPQYMSPERCRTGEASASSDVYSLGVLIFQMLTGRLPHEANTAMELVKRIIAEPPARLRQYAPELPDEVERFTAWLIERRPENRPACADEARRAMTRLLAGQPLDLNPSPMASALADFRTEIDKRKKRRRSGKRPSAQSITTQTRDNRRATFAFVCAAGIVAASVIGWALGVMRPASAELPIVAEAHVERWFVPAQPAAFYRESDNVWMARIELPEYSVADLTWDRTSGDFVALLGSNAAESQLGLITLKPDARVSRVAATPAPLRVNRMQADLAGHLATAWIANAGPDSAYAIGGLTIGAPSNRDHANAIPEVSAYGRLQRVAGHPNGNQFLAVYDGNGGEATLIAGEISNPIAHQRIATAGTFTAIGFAGADRYWYAATSNGEQALFAGESGNAEPTRIWSSPFTINRNGINPDGTHAALIADGELHAIAMNGETNHTNQGPASDAAWINANRLAVLAPDTKGHQQLWQIQRDANNARQQLTYLDGGLQRPIATSEDGQWIAAIPNTQPSPTVLFAHTTN